MRDWGTLAVIIFMILICIPVVGIPLAFLFAYTYCDYKDGK